MKRRVAALLLVSVLGSGFLTPAVALPDDQTLSKNLPVSEQGVSADPGDPAGTSLLDLSLFGVITLGVIGLFWIRRHTSEL